MNKVWQAFYLILLLICVSCSLKPAPSSSNSFVLRFRSQQSGEFISLDEEKVVDIYQLNLSDYQFPDNYPFTIQDNTLFLKVTIDGEPTFLIETDLNQETIFGYCTPDPNLKNLLCQIPSSTDIGMSQVTSILEDNEITEEVETRRLNFMGVLHATYVLF